MSFFLITFSSNVWKFSHFMCVLKSEFPMTLENLNAFKKYYWNYTTPTDTFWIVTFWNLVFLTNFPFICLKGIRFSVFLKIRTYNDFGNIQCFNESMFGFMLPQWTWFELWILDILIFLITLPLYVWKFSHLICVLKSEFSITL